MPSTKEIKRRIRSVNSTKKITRAMQMISAVKMRKAQNAVLSSRAYSELAWQIVTNLSHRIDPKYHALLENPNKSKKVGVILITTNRGMVGAYNANLTAETQRYLAQNKLDGELVAELIAVGKKGRDAMVRVGKTIVAEFPKADRALRIEEIFPLSRMMVDEYLKGTYSQILIAYTHFVSTIRQQPMVRLLLPLKTAEHPKDLPEHYQKFNYEYQFEPDPTEVLDYLLPRIIDAQIYQAVLENDASEHSARMVMMKNATDAATDLIQDLTLTYNQLRQANITKELAEIIAGMGK